VAVLDPDPGCPAAPAADRFEQGALDDPAAARRLAAGCAVVTACDERVSHEILRAIDDGEVAVRPGPYAIRVTHDRLELRRYLEANGVRVADGRASGTDAELSVVVARGADGTIASYPVGRDERETEAEAVALAADLAADLAVEMAADLATGLGLVGLLTVEMHLGLGGAFAVRKLVPRPSSTGLWTTETTTTGQFEQLVRAICGLPLGPTDLWPGQAAATLRRDAERSAAPGRNMGGVSAAAGPPAGSEDTEAGTA
jgi:phosphoribosylaminoimidazole carboxylase (NCAIR synthetase)